jgi:hypothetical protein
MYSESGGAAFLPYRSAFHSSFYAAAEFWLQKMKRKFFQFATNNFTVPCNNK